MNRRITEQDLHDAFGEQDAGPKLVNQLKATEINAYLYDLEKKERVARSLTESDPAYQFAQPILHCIEQARRAFDNADLANFYKHAARVRHGAMLANIETMGAGTEYGREQKADRKSGGEQSAAKRKKRSKQRAEFCQQVINRIYTNATPSKRNNSYQVMGSLATSAAIEAAKELAERPRPDLDNKHKPWIPTKRFIEEHCTHPKKL